MDVRNRVHEMTPGSRIIEVTQGRVPLALVFSDSERSSQARGRQESRDHDELSHNQVFASRDWTCDRPLSLPKLRSALETLPEAVYRCKGIIYLEELPTYRYVLQMVGKRYHLTETESWGDEFPRSEIVLIGGRDGIDSDALQRTFDECIGTGDETQSPILRLVRKIAPELLTQHHPVRRPVKA